MTSSFVSGFQEVREAPDPLVGVGGGVGDLVGPDLPDLLAILLDGAVTGELGALCHVGNGHPCPFLLVPIGGVSPLLCIAVRCEISAQCVVILPGLNPANVGLDFVVHREFIVEYHLEDLLQSAVNLALAGFVTQSTVVVDLINIGSEDEHIFFSNFLSNFNISTVHSTYDEGTVHNEFHV